jgi:hypothetical protein
MTMAKSLQSVRLLLTPRTLWILTTLTIPDLHTHSF